MHLDLSSTYHLLEINIMKTLNKPRHNHWSQLLSDINMKSMKPHLLCKWSCSTCISEKLNLCSRNANVVFIKVYCDRWFKEIWELVPKANKLKGWLKQNVHWRFISTAHLSNLAKMGHVSRRSWGHNVVVIPNHISRDASIPRSLHLISLEISWTFESAMTELMFSMFYSALKKKKACLRFVLLNLSMKWR